MSQGGTECADLELTAAGVHRRQHCTVSGVLPLGASRLHCDKVITSAMIRELC